MSQEEAVVQHVEPPEKVCVDLHLLQEPGTLSVCTHDTHTPHTITAQTEIHYDIIYEYNQWHLHTPLEWNFDLIELCLSCSFTIEEGILAQCSKQHSAWPEGSALMLSLPLLHSSIWPLAHINITFSFLTQSDVLAFKVEVFENHNNLASLRCRLCPTAHLTALNVIPGKAHIKPYK